jgi:hypothetical protein
MANEKVNQPSEMLQKEMKQAAERMNAAMIEIREAMLLVDGMGFSDTFRLLDGAMERLDIAKRRATTVSSGVWPNEAL